jgi:sensor histidine kinase YesM
MMISGSIEKRSSFGSWRHAYLPGSCTINYHKPFNRLSNTAELVSEGKLETSYVRGLVQDELGQLGRTFNKMIEQLQASD